MKMVKKSKYNIIYKNPQSEILIVNGLYNTFIKFDNKLSRIIENIFNNSEIEINTQTQNATQNTIKFLYKNNILVDKNLNENKLVDFEYKKMAYGDKTLRLTIIPTDACNFKCAYCYEEENNNYMSVENSDRIINFIKQNLKYFGSLRIAWFGGEPLLAKKLIIPFMKKVKQIASFYKVPVISEMTTNGYFLTQSLFENLFDCGIISYQVTLDGFKDIHNRMRPMKNGRDSYTTIYNNLLNIKNNTNKKAIILIRVNFNFEYQDETLNFIKHIEKVFLNDSRFLLNVQGIRNWGGDRVKELDIKPFSKYGDAFNKLIDTGIDPSGGISNLKYAQDLCNAAKTSSYFINWDLSVHKCSLALNHGMKGIGYINQYGKLVVDKLEEIKWTERRAVPKSCYNCELYPYCMSNICPYVFNIKKQIQCEDFRFSFFNKIKVLEKNAKVLHFDDIVNL